MIDICNSELSNLDMLCNASKTHILRVGARYKAICKQLHIGNTDIDYVDKLKYLGVTICAAKKFNVSVHDARIKYFVALNSVLAKCGKLSELSLQHLAEAYCKPLLCYAAETGIYDRNVVASLKFSWNTCLHRIFGVTNDNIVLVQRFTGHLPFETDVLIRKLSFLFKCKVLATNSVISMLFAMFGVHVLKNLLAAVGADASMSFAAAKKHVMDNFFFIY
jgi:hypothetical protein